MRALAIIAILSFAGSQNSFANDSDRIDLLEREVRDLKIRISKLEAPQDSQVSQSEARPLGQGWRSVANWRKLTTSMGPKDVRKLLGEPGKIDGGAVARWYYHKGGMVTFINDKAFSWEEPEQ